MRKTLLAITAAIAVYEAAALINEQDGDTISENVWELTAKYPLVPFGFGMIAGHFFWQNK